MSFKLHSSLIGADVHGPKGVDSAPNGAILVADGVGGSKWYAPAEENLTVTVLGQTAFALSNPTPLQGLNGLMFVEVNGVDMRNEFTISGSSLTYIGSDFLLDTTDKIYVVYFFN